MDGVARDILDTYKVLRQPGSLCLPARFRLRHLLLARTFSVRRIVLRRYSCSVVLAFHHHVSHFLRFLPNLLLEMALIVPPCRFLSVIQDRINVGSARTTRLATTGIKLPVSARRVLRAQLAWSRVRANACSRT